MPLDANLNLFGKTIVEAPANEHTTALYVQTCHKHPGVPLAKKRKFLGTKLISALCTLCELEASSEFQADPRKSRNQVEKIGLLAKQYMQLCDELHDTSTDIDSLAEELNRIKSKLEQGVPPREAINMRRVTVTVEEAMGQVNKRFDELDAKAASNQMYAVDQVKGLRANIADVKQTMVAFHGKSDEALRRAEKALQDTVAEMNRLAKKMDDKNFKWGNDIKQIREELERTHDQLGGLKAAVAEVDLRLSNQTKQAIKTFSRKYASLENRLDALERRVGELEGRVTSQGTQLRQHSKLISDHSTRLALLESQQQQPPVMARATVVNEGSSTNREAAPSTTKPSSFSLQSWYGPQEKAATPPLLVVRTLQMESCHVRRSGPSAKTSTVLEEIRNLQSNIRNESRTQQTMRSLLGCAMAYVEDDRALSKEPLQESELAVIVEAMKTGASRKNAGIQTYGCWSLANLARNSTNQERIARVGGIEVVTNAMKLFPFNEDVQWPGCYAVFELVSNNPTNQEAAMAASEDDTPILVSCCEPITSGLGWNNGSILVLGLVLDAMKQFPDYALVQANGCLALGALAQNNSRHAKRIGRQRQGDGDVIQWVLDVAKRFSSEKNDFVTARACFALESLAGASKENQARMKELDGVDVARVARLNLSPGVKFDLENDLLPSLNNWFLFS